MNTKIPPPLVFVTVILLTWGLSALVPVTSFAFPLQSSLAMAFGFLGGLVIFLAAGSFAARKTTINPHHPERASTLVTDGVFLITRNPMYLGLSLIALGAVVYWGQPFGLAFLIAAGWFVTQYQIKPEEAALRESFGEAYEAYCKRVRRWL